MRRIITSLFLAIAALFPAIAHSQLNQLQKDRGVQMLKDLYDGLRIFARPYRLK